VTRRKLLHQIPRPSQQSSTTHSQLTPQEQEATGVSDGYVRLSVRIEHINDIITDIERGLKAAGGLAKAA
jgi:O-acetylhomoserine (thiol)-lyase